MSESHLRVAIGALAVAGLGVASYLTYSRYAGTQLYCATGGCETVQHSRYALIAGIPVAVFGLAAYLAILGTAVARGPSSAAVGFGLAAAGVAFSAYLLVAQLFVIHAICQYCVASDVVVTLLAVTTWARFALAQRAVPAAA
ncbi:MAG TPA: vitamin K epoxide reductase family protein [Gaiellaceae bacterium]|jgi:uncharacterized membrane protein|nr:vitamin K epoxide reductase family protein [Gaiellaceae bacterium]